MKVYTFGDAEKPAVLLLPGTCCHWESNFGQDHPAARVRFSRPLRQLRRLR